MSSLKQNAVLNAINTVTGIIFPVITFPYASRVLAPEGIGSVNFLSSIVQYIVLLTSLGIPMYAVREIAKYRENINIRNKIGVEIIILNLILCLFGYIAVYLLGKHVPQINAQLGLFYILSLTIFFTGISVEWFYRGIEDFKFITIRAIIVRTLAAISLFIFVRDKSDLLFYGAVTVGASVGNNIINFIHLRKHIQIREIPWKRLEVARHIKPALHIFILSLITSIYVNLDSVMLGFIKGESAVGLYSAGVKLSHVVLSLVTSLGVVMIPRCSNLIQNGDHENFSRICGKAIRLVIATALPMCIGLILLAYPIIILFCGREFVQSALVLQWVAPIILFVGITNVLGLQVLYPQNRENTVIWSVAGGAFINLCLNLWLIPKYAQTGAAIATCIAEFVVLLLQVVLGRKYIPFKFSDCKLQQYVPAVLLMALSVLVVRSVGVSNLFVQMILSVCIGGAVYGGYLLLIKNETAEEIVRLILKK